MLPAGSRVGDYEIEAELGEGGMARVYRARHVLLDTHHALKVLDPELRANAEARRRFLDEAKIQAKHLDHPGIVKVTNIVASPEHAALVMELVEGTSLEAEVGSLVDRPDEVRRIMIGVLEAVGHAHAQGIVHRDLKPANVLLAGAARVPKVTDFGIAKATGDASGKKKSTHVNARMGTLDYMSPEQIRSAKNVTARSDIFSLGAMLYELATGTLPFQADNDFDLMEKIVNGRYTPPATKNPRIDPGLAKVIERALEPDEQKRFASCAEMAAALGAPPARPAVPATVPVGTRPATERSSDDAGGGGRALFLAGTGVIVLATGILIYTQLESSRPAVAAPAAADLARFTRDLPGEGPLIATIRTKVGTLHCELFADKAPRTVANFVGLATGQVPWIDPKTQKVVRDRPFYDGLTFHRSIEAYGVHGGDPLGTGEGGPGYRFADEIVPSLTHEPGTLVMWSVGPNKNGSQFAIYDRTMPQLDGAETIFGRCDETGLVTRLVFGTKPVTIEQVTIARRQPAVAVGNDATVPPPSPKGNERLRKLLEKPRKGPDPSKVYAVPLGAAPATRGDARVTLVKAFDYACPYCLRSNPTIAELERRYGADFRVVYKHLVVHRDTAMVSALAACAASRQGRFRDMDARLWRDYENRQLESSVGLCWLTSAGCPQALAHARALGLDEERFRADMRSYCPALVARDGEEMAALGVHATPGFFVNGRFVAGAMPVETFTKLIDEELRLFHERRGAGADATGYYEKFVLEAGLPRVE